jgi:sugar phosphate isomerase/epimerase
MMKMQTSRRGFLAALPLPVLFGADSPKQIRVGCQANAWPLKVGDFAQLLGILGEMKKLEYAGFECNVRFLRGQFGRIAEARKEIEATGVRLIGAHTSVAESSPETFPQTVAGVAALGAECIMMSGPGLAPDGKFSAEALKQKAGGLEALARTCAQKGIRLCYHNHNPEFANGNAEMEGLAAGTSPELVSFLMDAGHGYLGGGNPAEFLQRHAARIFGCHLKTFRAKGVPAPVQVPLGKGDFDFQALAAAVRKTGWKGWLITEEGGLPTPGDPAAVGPDRSYIRRVFSA